MTRRRVVRCAHTFCRVTLTEGNEVQCPHGVTFCGDCQWEGTCVECSGATPVDLQAELAKSVELLAAIRPPYEPPPAWTCRCGHRGNGMREVAARADLRVTDDDVLVGRNTQHRTCGTCPHLIPIGAPVVTTTDTHTRTFHHHYHPECVVI